MTGRLKLWHGNIVDLDVDAVVNAAYRVPADLAAQVAVSVISQYPMPDGTEIRLAAIDRKNAGAIARALEAAGVTEYLTQ